MQHKLKARDKTAKEYGLNSNSIFQYLRINKLIKPLKSYLDNGSLALRAAVALSHLSVEEQQTLSEVIESSDSYKLDMKKAETLKLASEKKPLTFNDIQLIITGTKEKMPASRGGFKLNQKVLKKYFNAEQKSAEIENTIFEALEFFFANKNKTGN